MGYRAVQLVEAPRYKPVVAGTIPGGVVGIFHFQKSVPGVCPGGKGGRCLGLTPLPP